MEIIVAKSAGFCFGVKNALEKVNSLNKEKEVKTYGPIIHNKQVVEDLRQKGVTILDDLSNARKGSSVVIRSHGISKAEFKVLEEREVDIVDATCPFVKNIHRIVEKKCNENYKVVIIGDESHPEVKGISGWCNNAFIISKKEEVNNLKGGKLCVVAQTTFDREKWKEIICSIIGTSKEIVIFDTICSATDERQSEAREMSKLVNLMIVIGGKDSSNSRKLYDIANKTCENAIFIETEEELDLSLIKGCDKVGITAGASTPQYLIDRVIKKIKGLEVDINVEKQMEEISDEDFDMYFSKMENVHVGSRVKGTIIHVGNKEMYVDIGYKSDAVLEISQVPSVSENFENYFSKGEIIEADVVKLNNGEGNVLLSRVSIEKDNEIEKIRVYEKSGEEIEVKILEEIKGGYRASFNGFRVFMPSSLSGVKDSSEILNKKVKVNISEIKEDRKDIQLVVSRKEILEAEKENKIRETFDSLVEGKKISGTVKAIIEPGLFINIGDVDVFVPKAEVSWSRNLNIKDKYREGTRAEAVILRVDNENKKVSGSIKRLEKEPFENMLLKYKEEDIIPVKVLRFTDFGVFVEVVEGVDGLVHISKISKDRINRPEEALKIGQSVNAKIIKIDETTKKVELSIKDAN
ncbi:bifunctional 4-hydroxy-3-methylbut-2-enyl diphosphate reductase/30S ribosomal protein S1 [Clostridium cylindrosporum]|uniref:4-hydroxy-3-methylbut-2-enyl diphosphate reductase n=1 Tax=Clostridium cylindrosporum DSM 605 TaxID=1121307 RepID=A0A0J8DAQ8_CLOCY|nr:bifunctional 4-hydroxy-3-methylbut-2-enyl diphosphate reductase/30S ribosomal protein S1 [Clostridium cylindrosporum]KMT21388.1 4-hydroxy-3-methylbut-2-enyl diphosphate reductase IspH [Clostridium cylindrosporum DSM 605]